MNGHKLSFCTAKVQRGKEYQPIQTPCPFATLSLCGKTFAQVMPVRSIALPLDNRSTYTKLDWILWTATLADNTANFAALADPAYKFAHETPTRAPLSDWYWTTASSVTFRRARSWAEYLSSYWRTKRCGRNGARAEGCACVLAGTLAISYFRWGCLRYSYFAYHAACEDAGAPLHRG